ncbi:MAG: acyloxyacyl hydrolase [Lentisphaerota bacterium]
MNRHLYSGGAGLLLLIFGLMLVTSAFAAEQELFVSAGEAGIFRGPETAVFTIEYRPGFRVWKYVGFWLSGESAFDEGYWIGAGFLLDIPIGSRWLIRPSFGGGYYHTTSTFDLGSPLEFRSNFEVDFNITHEWITGLALGHYSNGGITDQNPGAETLRLLVGRRF